MSGVPATALIALIAVLDAAFSGFRAAKGRAGVIRHRAEDVRALSQGLGVGVVLSFPALAALAWCLASPGGRTGLREAAVATMWLLGPASVAVLAALSAYLVLSWEFRYLASAVILGPFTLIRPWIAVAFAVLAGVTAGRLDVWLLVLFGTAALLAIEPIVGRLWWSERPVPQPGSPDHTAAA